MFSFLPFFDIVCVCVCHLCHRMCMRVRAQPVGVGSLVPPHGFAGFELRLSGLAADTFTY